MPLALLMMDGAAGQTPWEAAPARPAPLPIARQPAANQASNVVGLPPPPKSPSPAAKYATMPLRRGESSVGAFTPAEQVPAQPFSDAALKLPPLPSNSNSAASVFQSTRIPAENISVPIPLPFVLNSPPSAAATVSPGVRTNLDPPALNYNPPGTTAEPNTESAAPIIEEFQPGELIAVVGAEHVLAGDMYVFVDPIIEQYRDKIANESQEKQVRAQLTRQALKQYVEIKAMYQEFFRNMVGNKPPKEMLDAQQQVTNKAGRLFFEKQVPNLMKKHKARDLQELEDILRQKNMSLVTLKTQFIEQVLAGQAEQSSVPEKYDIEPSQIMEYYRQHREEWAIPARARWRQITVRFDKHATRAEAEQRIIQLGNEMLLGGKSFEAVAKQSSEGYTADKGGVYDWTNQGSLKSEALDAAIFSLDLRKLSRVIEDDIGLHIVEVLEREPARERALAESQAEIRDKLSDAKRQAAVSELRDRVMKRTPIWTRWPEDIPGSRPLSQALGEEFGE